MYTDSHAHYDDPRFDEDRDKLLSSFAASGVGQIINVGSGMKSSKESIALARKYPFIRAAVGVHPHDAENMKDADLDELKTLAADEKVTAIGEIGLDYYYPDSKREAQRLWFVKQLRLALELKKPVIIHSRDAVSEIFEILSGCNGGANGGVIHCFSSSVEMAHRFIDMGFHIGIGGTVTFKNAKKVQEVAAKIPLSKILLETDCPYLSPEPNRGKRNDSANLKFIAEKIAQIRQITAEELLEVTNRNVKEIFDV